MFEIATYAWLLFKNQDINIRGDEWVITNEIYFRLGVKGIACQGAVPSNFPTLSLSLPLKGVSIYTKNDFG